MSGSRIIIALAFFVIGLFCLWKAPFFLEKKEDHLIQEEVLVQQEKQEEKSPTVISIANEEKKERRIPSVSSDDDLPTEVDIVERLFDPKRTDLLPIVETVRFVSRVPWLPSRPAYLGDWAAYFETSRHFISRSMKGTGNYLHEQVARGDRFNVFRKDKSIEFHLVVDLSRTKLWLYYFDKEENKRELLKSYPVCLGKLSTEKASGSLTPTGLFEIGKEVAIYKEGDMGLYKNEPCEMITVFGQRWIPLSREIAHCSGSCKGLGIHGMPWTKNETTGQCIESREMIGGYNSLGCIRLLTEDVQELFSIITSKPSYVHIVKDFQDARLPGVS